MQQESNFLSFLMKLENFFSNSKKKILSRLTTLMMTREGLLLGTVCLGLENEEVSIVGTNFS